MKINVMPGGLNNPCFSGHYSDYPTDSYYTRPSETRRCFYEDDFPDLEKFYVMKGCNGPELPEPIGGCDATVNSQGVMCLRLSNAIKIYMTVDGAIRVQNLKSNTVLALDKSDKAAAMIHPQGVMYYRKNRGQIMAYHPNGHRLAKIWSKGISFTSENCPITYLTDEAGTRTTSDYFDGMNYDITLNIFYNDFDYTENTIARAVTLLREAQYWEMNDCTKCWIVNNVKILQKPDGFVRIQRNNYASKIRTSPANGSAAITTPEIHCTASLGIGKHLFFRKESQRIHYNGIDFIVRNCGQSAGLSTMNLLKLY